MTAYRIITWMPPHRYGPGHWIRDGLALVGLGLVGGLFLILIQSTFGG